jgi:flagellar hook protein FlgE
MGDMIDFSTPLKGLDTATFTVNKAAQNIAKGSYSSDTVDLSHEVVSLMQGQNDFAANVKVLKTEDQMTQSLLDITA